MTSPPAPSPLPQPGGSLTTAKIVFLVVAAVAPMAAVVGTLPLAFVLGTGPGTPAAFVMAGVVLLLFGVGYAEMSRHVVSTGAFYTYIRHGLGRVPAVAGAYVAVLAYNVFAVGLTGAFAYFTRLALIDLAHVTIPWPWLAAAALAIVALLGRRQIDLSARTLALLLTAEVVILLVLDAAITLSKGASAFPATSFAPHTATHGALGVTVMFAFISFLGFESAALYGEEARDPRRSVPRAIYASVGLISVFYAVTSWIAVGGIGAGHVQERSGSELGNLFISLTVQYVDSPMSKAMEVVLCTSLLASLLSMHNACSRYMYALGRDRLLPTPLGTSHRSGAPAVASGVQIVIAAVVAGAFALAGLDPYLDMATSMLGLGTVGIIALQAAAAVAIIAYFRRRPAAAATAGWWRVLAAPGLGAIGLLAALVLVLRNFDALTGTTSSLVHALPWLVLVAAAAGAGWACWLRAARPATYQRLAEDDGGEPAPAAGPVPDGVDHART
ncbi:APC family permease [Streptomyces sp. IBSBF 2435]|uniref:APC family permease n=1 Tax=Streptomyces sp. IBSBF 2435 TaxID=2903531 RepID=UPI002FDC60E5